MPSRRAKPARRFENEDSYLLPNGRVIVAPRCPICGAPQQLYTLEYRRGAARGRSHGKGVRRTKREFRKTCGRPDCRTMLRAHTTLKPR